MTSLSPPRAGVGGLPLVKLRAADGATADVYLHGAHVTSWRPTPGDEERLFLSARSEFRPGTAIRGGIPVIFPQFAAEGPLVRHGFARTSEWRLDDVPEVDTGEAGRGPPRWGFPPAPPPLGDPLPPGGPPCARRRRPPPRPLRARSPP